MINLLGVIEKRGSMAYFPFFTEMKNRTCLIVGSGTIARSKMRIFLEFEADVTCISPQLLQEPGVRFIQKEVQMEDLVGFDVVVAATDNHELNHRISLECQKLGIPVNVVDQKDDCTFIFPSILHYENVVAAFSSGGRNPVITQYMKKQASSFIDERLGQINEKTGQIRDLLMDMSPAERKIIMQKVLDAYLSGEESDEEIRKRYITCRSE